MFKIVIVDDDRQMQAIIRDKIKEKTDAFRDAKFRSFLLRKPFWQRPNRKSTEKRAICSL